MRNLMFIALAALAAIVPIRVSAQTSSLGLTFNEQPAVGCPITFAVVGSGALEGSKYKVASTLVHKGGPEEERSLFRPLSLPRIRPLTPLSLPGFVGSTFRTRSLVADDKGLWTVTVSTGGATATIAFTVSERCSLARQAGAQFAPIRFGDTTVAIGITLNEGATPTDWSLNGVTQPDKWERTGEDDGRETYEVAVPATFMSMPGTYIVALMVQLPSGESTEATTSYEVVPAQ